MLQRFGRNPLCRFQGPSFENGALGLADSVRDRHDRHFGSHCLETVPWRMTRWLDLGTTGDGLMEDCRGERGVKSQQLVGWRRRRGPRCNRVQARERESCAAWEAGVERGR